MSEFRDRLRSIREKAEREASQLGEAKDARLVNETEAEQSFQEYATEIGDLIEEFIASFAEEYDKFEANRVTMDGGQCIRLSRIQEVTGSRRLSRLSFSIEHLPDNQGLHVVAKGIVWNRERGHDELTLPLGGGEEARQRVKQFAEGSLIQFASDYEEIRIDDLRPIP